MSFLCREVCLPNTVDTVMMPTTVDAEPVPTIDIEDKLEEFDKISAALPKVKGLGDISDAEFDDLAAKAEHFFSRRYRRCDQGVDRRRYDPRYREQTQDSSGRKKMMTVAFIACAFGSVSALSTDGARWGEGP